MRYRQLGKTGLRISEIGFGAGDNAGLMVGDHFQEQCRVFSHALELGINYVDTAAGYGAGQSEISLGRVLKEAGLRPLINTKVELTEAQLDDPAAGVVASVEASLRRLGVEYVDIVQIHNSPVFRRPEQWTGWMPLTMEDYLGSRGAIEGLRRLKQAGKARYTGLINERPYVALAKALISTGEFDLLNVQYNLLNPTAGMPTPPGFETDQDNGDIISFAAEHGMGSAIYSPLRGGVLTDQALAGAAPHPLARDNRQRNAAAYEVLLNRARKFTFLSVEGRSIAQAAVQFILRHPGVTTALGGFTGVEQVDDYAGALDAPPLTETELARIEMVWSANFGEA